MKQWKYADSTNRVVFFMNESCSVESAEIQEWLAAGNTPIPADVPTLAQAKAEQVAKINQAADAAFDAIKAPYPKNEPDTWANQRDEAMAYQSNAAASTPTIDGIALASGYEKPALVSSIMGKVAIFSSLSGQIVGKRKKLTDQINAETTDTIEKVSAITW